MSAVAVAMAAVPEAFVAELCVNPHCPGKDRSLPASRGPGGAQP